MDCEHTALFSSLTRLSQRPQLSPYTRNFIPLFLLKWKPSPFRNQNYKVPLCVLIACQNDFQYTCVVPYRFTYTWGILQLNLEQAKRFREQADAAAGCRFVLLPHLEQNITQTSHRVQHPHPLQHMAKGFVYSNSLPGSCHLVTNTNEYFCSTICN